MFFFSKGACPKNPGTNFLGKKKRLRQCCWEYCPFKKDLKIDETVLFFVYGSVLGDLGWLRDILGDL